MYKGIEIAKLFTITFTSNKFTHLFSSSHANALSPRTCTWRSLLWEKDRGFSTTFSSPPNVVARGGGRRGHWDAIHTTSALDFLYARTLISPICVPGHRGISVSKLKSKFCKRTNCAASCTCTWFFPSWWFVSLSSDSIKSYCTDLYYIGQVSSKHHPKYA